MKINDLDAVRYSITGLANGSVFSLSAAGAPIAQMATTYQDLIIFHEQRLRKDSSSSNPSQIVRNHLTALNALMASVNKSVTSPIGAEMGDEFSAAVRNCLEQAGISARSISDRRSILNAWKTSFQYLGAAPEVTVRGRERRRADSVIDQQTPFEHGLKLALSHAGLAPRKAATLAGVSTSAIGRWCRGALPNLRSTDTLTKLDKVLELPSGHLAALLKQSTDAMVPTHRDEYRQRLKERKSDGHRYLRLEEVSPQLRQQWHALVTYKTASRAVGLQRNRRGRWSASGGSGTLKPIPGISLFAGSFYASAGIAWIHLRSYYGFLLLAREKGGYGLLLEQVQTLAWLAVPEAIDAFLNFTTLRSGGLRHTGHAVFASFISSLLHPAQGYLTQQEVFLDDLPQEVRRDQEWVEMCAEAFSVAGDWRRSSHDVSRSVVAPIQFLLDQKEPLLPVFDAMRALRRRGDKAAAGGIEEALARRDELIIGVLISNPLRSKNIVELTYLPNNSGELYESSPGNWRIRPSKLKNRASDCAARYDVAIAPWLNSLVSDYIKYFRPALQANRTTDKVFISKRATKLSNLGSMVSKLTRQLIPGTGGFGPHAFRHLVATDWLIRNPNDFLTVALLLNDTLEVVMKSYAHLKRDHALARHSAQLGEILPDYLRNNSRRIDG